LIHSIYKGDQYYTGIYAVPIIIWFLIQTIIGFLISPSLERWTKSRLRELDDDEDIELEVVVNGVVQYIVDEK
jgi:hypothetical protein